MIDPSLELHLAIYNTLSGASAVYAIVGESPPRVYDRVPEDATFPYISLAQPQVLPDRADCIDGAETFFGIDGWSREVGSVEIKRLGAAIAFALDQVEFVLAGHRTVLCEVQQIQYLDDPDGITKHTNVLLRTLTEPLGEVTGFGALVAQG